MLDIKAKNSENQPLIGALAELAEAMSEAGGADSKTRFKASSIEKAARSLADLDKKITEGKMLAQPGPNKVPGVGKGTAYYIDEFLSTGRIAEIEKYKDKKAAAVTPDRKKEDDGDIVVINRSPVLKLWVVVVAEKHGFNSIEAHSYAQWIAGIFAQAKGRSLGIFEEEEEPRKKKQKTEETEKVHFFQHVKVPVKEQTNGDLLAVSQGKVVHGAESSLHSAFGSRYEDAKKAMETLASSMSKDKLKQRAYSLYEQFRPEWIGWGQKSTLNLNTIRKLAEKSG